MLPHIHPKYWLVASRKWTVLVGGGLNSHCAVWHLHQPGPAAAEHVHRGVGQLVLKCAQRAELSVNCLGQLASGPRAAFAQRRPPERVIGVTATIVANGCADGFRYRI